MSVSHAANQEALDRVCMPDLSIEDVRNIQREGIARIGRAFALLTTDGMLLTGLHRDEGQNGHPKKGMKGPISETVAGRVDDWGRLTYVENMHQTFARCVLEELGVRPSELPLFFGHDRRAPLTTMPIDQSRKLLAQTAVLFLGQDFDHEQFVKTFRPTLELESIQFLPIDQVYSQKLRPGMKEWLDILDTQNFLTPQIGLVRAKIPDPRPEPLVIDLKLDTMPNL